MCSMLLTDLLQTKTLTLDLHQRDYRACKTIVCEIRLEDSLAQYVKRWKLAGDR